MFILVLHAIIVIIKFILYLFIIHEVLQLINILSTQLQSKGITLGKSGILISGIISTLENNLQINIFQNFGLK